MDKQITKKRKLADIHLSEQLQDEYISFVHERVGILIKRDHKELIRAITAACDEYHYSPDEYLQALRNAEDNSELISHLVSSITIGETYFFRDKQQVKLLNEVVLPKMIEKKIARKEKTLRIWSAGCSSGEEIYTIVMLLMDLLPDINQWQCNFLATDINIDVLKKGISGVYGEWSMRSIPEEYLTRYFDKSGITYTLDDNIKKRVTFEYVNLNSDTYPSIMNGTTMQDLIICRNVLIYFDNDHIKSILDKLSKCIVEDGYILLGASDPIAMMNTGIGSVHGYPSLFMKKSSMQTVTAADTVRRATMPFNEKQYTTEKAIPVRPVTRPSEVRYQEKKAPSSLLNRSISDEVNALLQAEQWSEVIDKLDMCAMTGKLTPAQLVAKATALANVGKTADAIKACEESLLLDKMNKEAYFLYAVTLSEVKRNKEAEAAYRKALYIDPDFLVCRYQFGLFLIHIDRFQEGIKALENTIKSASQFDETAVVPDSQNLKYKDLITVLKNEISLHQ